MTAEELENFASDRTWGEDAYKGYLMAVEDIKNGTLKLAALSPAKQELQGWIDIKTALPEPESEYEKFQIVVEYLDNIFEEVPKFKRYVDVACFNKKYKCWLTASDGEIIDDREDCNIILWQPLAALPYTEEK